MKKKIRLSIKNTFFVAHIIVVFVDYSFFDLLDKSIRFFKDFFNLKDVIDVGNWVVGSQRRNPFRSQITYATESKTGVVFSHEVFETRPHQFDRIRHTVLDWQSSNEWISSLIICIRFIHRSIWTLSPTATSSTMWCFVGRLSRAISRSSALIMFSE